MRHKRLQLSAILLLGLGLTGLQAQERINTAGGDASGSGGSVSFSIGQLVYQTHTGTNGSVAKGVQQPFEISVVIGSEETERITFMVSAYPNPVVDCITLSIREVDISNLSYHLFDVNGKLLRSEKITASHTNIEMGKFVTSCYFLKVTRGNKEVKTFTIIKN